MASIQKNVVIDKSVLYYFPFVLLFKNQSFTALQFNNLYNFIYNEIFSIYWASKLWRSSYPDIHTDAPAYKINGYNIKLKLVYYVRKKKAWSVQEH